MDEIVSPLVRQIHSGALSIFKDSYVVEFLNLPENHSEADLHRSLLRDLGRFITELGRDFCFVGSEYPIQVGNRDFALDLLFLHRGLNCLVAIELKVGRFEPEHLGKLEFYLGVLYRNVRKPHERPSIGILLCASKDSEVVPAAIENSMAPAPVAPPTGEVGIVRVSSPQTPQSEFSALGSLNRGRFLRRNGRFQIDPRQRQQPLDSVYSYKQNGSDSERSRNGLFRIRSSQNLHRGCTYLMGKSVRLRGLAPPSGPEGRRNE